MREIWHKNTLFYFDGPQIIEATDSIGGSYIAVMVGEVDGMHEYLVTGVNPESLRRFKAGDTELRSLLLEGSKSNWYTAIEPENEGDSYVLTERDGPLDLHEEYLPEPGFVLHYASASEDVVRASRTQANLVWEVIAEPPESVGDHQMKATTLAGLLFLLQRVVKRAYAAALSELKESELKNIDARDADHMRVMAFAPGSFKIFMTPACSAGFFGVSETARALSIFDKLLLHPDDVQRTQDSVSEFKGHLAKAYIDLLGFLATNSTGLSYSWAEPGSDSVRRRAVSLGQAKSLFETLSKNSSLPKQTVVLHGILDRVNVTAGTWGLIVDGEVRNGEVTEMSPSLDGLKVRGVYDFVCEEEININPSTGREKTVLFLVEVK